LSVPLVNDVLVQHHTELIAHALLQYSLQLRFSYLIERQWGSMNDIAAPNQDELWMHITMKTDWESPFPEPYLAPVSPGLPSIDVSINSGTHNMSSLTRNYGQLNKNWAIDTRGQLR
jgi:hypothetical protein